MRSLKAVVVIVILWQCLITFTNTTFAATTYRDFQRLSDQTGGRQSSVYHIYRDTSDFLWLATDTDGVLRYDGYDYLPWANTLLPDGERVSYSFLTVTDDETLWAATWGRGLVSWNAQTEVLTEFLSGADGHALHDDRVQTLYPDGQQRLWIGTLRGLNYALKDAATGQWQLSRLTAQHPLSQQRIWDVVERGQEIWVATSQGLFQLSADLQEWQRFWINPNSIGNNRVNEIRTVAVFENEIWVGTDTGVYVLDESSQAFEAVTFPTSSSRLSNVRSNVLIAHPDAAKAGKIWSGGANGLYQIDRAQRQFVKLSEDWNVLPDVDVRTIAFDSNASMWLGTRDQGIFRAHPSRQLFHPTLPAQQFADKGDVVGRAVPAVHYDRTGGLWLATTDAVFYQAPQQHDWQRLAFPFRQSVLPVEAMLDDSAGNLWVATSNGLFRTNVSAPTELEPFDYIHQQLGIEDVAVNALYESADNKLLLGLWGLGVASYDLVTQEVAWSFNGLQGLRGNQVYDIVAVEDVGEFIVTRYSGIYQRATEHEQWRPYQLPSAVLQPSDGFTCATEGMQRSLWLCSREGAWRIDLGQGDVQRIGIEQGLLSEHVVGIHATETHAWLLTGLGVSRYDKQSAELLNLGKGEGLPAEVMLRQAVAMNGNGQMTLGTVKGAVSFDAAAFNMQPQPPKVALSRLWVNGEDKTTSAGFEQHRLELDRRHRSLSIQYSVMDFHEAQRNRGRYRLLGVTDEWSEWSSSRDIAFATLPAGDYVLEVQGRSSFGVLSAAPLTINISVAKAWWQTVWAWLAFIVLFGGLAFIALKLRFRALESANQKLDQEVRARTKELEAVNAQLRSLSETDFLTGLLNRRGFMRRFPKVQAQMQRSQQQMCLVLMDVDYFKAFNDDYGHDVGDEVLRGLSRLIADSLMKGDLAARWGGEEFIVLLPSTNESQGYQRCEQLRRAIEAARIDVDGTSFKLTATFGLVAAAAENASLTQWVKAADEALYQGKASGRNKVVSAATTS
ncbi:ligand-binding sensor domain-containing diguanylate cyclase [Pseudidiomarina sediminum]|uniref:ligand-binding sensor domain-containing diguanylate cyclase n=1 Tax=Pseudidiomarina sediminum TaxID=431675 RepID=UPI001C97E267|nr:ligand-binding sensor domain-containing diguanylate cyclase [Pseudidiomarina sediminum]MBY6064160.1 diguanylate cyclase [Pseudidiomarina sediminum]